MALFYDSKGNIRQNTGDNFQSLLWRKKLDFC